MPLLFYMTVMFLLFYIGYVYYLLYRKRIVMERAISPVDGRYRHITEELANYWSEYALVKTKVKLEIEYLIELIKEYGGTIGIKMNDSEKRLLEYIYESFLDDDFWYVKSIETVIKHDTKAIEYYIRQKLREDNMDKFIPYIHFGITSQDIVGVAIVYLYKQSVENVIYRSIDSLIELLYDLSDRYKSTPMLSFTHGQPASPTTFGKELSVYLNKLIYVYDFMKNHRFYAKFGGATGTFSTFNLTIPSFDWSGFVQKFLSKYGLYHDIATTQIGGYDSLVIHMSYLKHLFTIIIDLCRDIWLYVSKGYIKLKYQDNDVGSSTMPHKVNPVYFENAEGHAIIGRDFIDSLIDNLTLSRLQRDLTDSSQSRYIGVALSFLVISLENIIKGLKIIEPDTNVINHDLNNHYEILSEAIQTLLRLYGYEHAYEVVKDNFHGYTNMNREQYIKKVDDILEQIHSVNNMDKEYIKVMLHDLTPYKYIGKSIDIVSKVLEKVNKTTHDK